MPALGSIAFASWVSTSYRSTFKITEDGNSQEQEAYQWVLIGALRNAQCVFVIIAINVTY